VLGKGFRDERASVRCLKPLQVKSTRYCSPVRACRLKLKKPQPLHDEQEKGRSRLHPRSEER
jgi:hypothetical protein